MSIFKETLDEGIQTQLKARTLVVNGINNNRSGLLPWYLSKNAWVRMTSFVNYTEGNIYLDGTGSVKVNPITGHYKGDQLSKKYILEGGTLYTKENNNQISSSLRYGVATANAVYGSNIDVRPNGTADSRYLRQLGLRPMPGITDVKMRTIGAYGSLFETTVNFHAWDTNQLNELELLFMRPGYSVLLEWGWSQYLSYTNTSSKNDLTELDIYPEKFLGQTINPFDPNLTQEAVYVRLEELRGKHHYNYDGMLGYVKNFNWKLRRDGGYDCSTTLISMGEMINTLKMNTNANTFNNPSDRLPDADEAASYIFDDFENVLLSLKSIPETEKGGDTVVESESGTRTVLATNTYISESAYFGVWEKNLNYVNIETIQTKLKEDGYTIQADYLSGTDFTKNPFKQYIENKSNINYGKVYEYLTLDVVVALIGSYVNLRSTDSKGREFNTVRIIPPSETDYCLAGTDSISIQPSICNVWNPGAFKNEISYFLFPGAGTGPQARYKKENGVIPKIYSFYKKFYDPNIKAGRLNRILVNIDFLLNVYRDLKNSSNESGVVMTDYLKNILNKISNALGGLNNFTLSTAGRDQNTLRIIDTYYFGQETKNETYQFDLLGLGSICKDVSIQSQIFQEQSTIVAIAAQSKANLGDVYNSTQVYLNAGLEDRLALAKWQGSEVYSTSANPDDPFYSKLAQLMAYARNYLIGFAKPNDQRGTIQVSDGGVDPHSMLKSALLRYDGEMNFKALIPFKLKITLEGIGGIVVGQIFTVKQNVLPKNYYDKNLGFIVTQIEHNLKDNQWETVLDTQICILDQQQFYDSEGKPTSTSGIKREGFGAYLTKRQIIGIIWPILIDYLIYQATRSIVGFIYSATDNAGGKGFKGMQTFIDNALESNNNNLKEYWEDNVGKFTNRYPSARSRTGEIFSYDPSNMFASNNVNSETNITRVYPLGGKGFEEFFIGWCKVWAKQNENILNNPFSETKTFGDVITFITNSDRWGENTDPEYKNFTKYIDIVKNLANTIPLEVFYPNNSKLSIYSNDSKVDYGKYGEAPSGSFINNSDVPNTSVLSFQHAVSKNNKNKLRRPYTGIRGWNYSKLYQKFEEILVQNFDSQLQTIFRNYNSNIEVGRRGSNESITKYFYPTSKVMYGQSSSLVITNTNVQQIGEAINLFSFNEYNSNIEIARNAGFVYLYKTDSSSESTTQTWAQTIDWNSYYRSNINDPNTTDEINAKWYGTDRPDYFWKNIEF